MKSLSRAQLLATPWTAAFHAPPSMGFLVGDKTVQNKETQNPTEPRGQLVMKKDSKRNNWWEEFSILLCYGQFLSHFWLFVTPWTAARQAPLSFTISWSLPKFLSIELMMLSNHLILCHPLLLLLQSLPASGSFSNESGLRIRWQTYWSFSFSISPSNEYSGLISFRMDWGII